MDRSHCLRFDWRFIMLALVGDTSLVAIGLSEIFSARYLKQETAGKRSYHWF